MTTHNKMEKTQRPYQWNYTVSSGRLWASCDSGTVIAHTYYEAVEKAIAELKYNFQKINDALAHCDNTAGFSVEFSEDHVEVTKIYD